MKIANPIYDVVMKYLLEDNKLARLYTDNATGEILTEKDPFIESLTHDSIVIQIPELKKHRRNELEKLLSIFDQTYKTQNIHILDIDETTIPTQFLPILRKLQAAIAEKQVRDTMSMEDEIIEELEDKERELEEVEELLDKALEEKQQLGKVLEEKDKVLEEKEKVLGEKNKTLEEQNWALEEQKRRIEELTRQLNLKK
jgi:chromosome segregation ATPase